jgi:hypothetical protein
MTEGRVGPSDMRNYELFMDRWGKRFERDLPGLLAAAEKAGYDLRDRVPARREVIDRKKRIEEMLERVDELDRREQEVTRLLPVLRRQQAEVDELRWIAGMRSVRGALALRRLVRTVFPRRD